jgi:hypothetical protein
MALFPYSHGLFQIFCVWQNPICLFKKWKIWEMKGRLTRQQREKPNLKKYTKYRNLQIIW